MTYAEGVIIQDGILFLSEERDIYWATRLSETEKNA